MARKARETVLERTSRLLDEFVAAQDAKRLAEGPEREMAPLYLLEVSAAVAKQARAALGANGDAGLEHAFRRLRPNAIVHRLASRVGDYETFSQLFRRLGEEPMIAIHLWTPARARRLLASIDAMRITHGDETKLARVLDEDMAVLWTFARPRPASVARRPLRLLTSMLRRAVERENAFALVQDLSLL